MSEATPAPKCKKMISGKQFVLNLVGILAIIPIAVVGIVHWTAAEQAEERYQLKRDLVRMGKSPEEIERIMNAGESRRYNYTRSRSTPISKPEVELVTSLAQAGLDAEEIVHVLNVIEKKQEQTARSRPSRTQRISVRDSEPRDDLQDAIEKVLRKRERRSEAGDAVKE